MSIKHSHYGSKLSKINTVIIIIVLLISIGSFAICITLISNNRESIDSFNNSFRSEIADINKIIASPDSYTVVSVNGTGDYSSLTEAVKNSYDGDIIFVMPGTYENEAVEAWGKTLYIIGTSKKDCIIKNNNGAYETPPMEIGSGLLKNLTIISEYNSGYSPNKKSYAVHVEDNDMYNKNLTIENCYIESQWNFAIGMGMRGGCNVEFKDCDMVGSDGTHGGLFVHDSNNDDYLGVQNLRIINSNIYSYGNDAVDLKIQSQCKESSAIELEFVQVNIRNLDTGSQSITLLNNNNEVYTVAPTINELTNFSLSKASYGNSVESLNYID